jgi:hypothetical protein
MKLLSQTLYKQAHLNSQNQQCLIKEAIEVAEGVRAFEHRPSKEVLYTWRATPDSPAEVLSQPLFPWLADLLDRSSNS